MGGIQPVSSAIPVIKPLKVRDDEEKKNKQNPKSDQETKQNPIDKDDDVQHIDEVV